MAKKKPCPNCGHKKTETMPTDACVYFYECENCKTRLKPLQGDCCVYCSYGTVKCPPYRQERIVVNIHEFIKHPLVFIDEKSQTCNCYNFIIFKKTFAELF